MPSEICARRSGGTGSVAAAADPLGAVGTESIRLAGLSLVDEGSHDRRGGRAVATGGLTGGGAGYGQSEL